MKKSLIYIIIITIIIMFLPPMLEDLNQKEASTLDVVEVNELISEIEASDKMVVAKSTGPYSFDYTILDKSNLFQ